MAGEGRRRGEDEKIFTTPALVFNSFSFPEGGIFQDSAFFVR